MKRNIKLICLLLFVNFLTNQAEAQALKDSIPVIISPQTVDTKAIDDVKLAIKAASSVRYIGFCSNHNVFLLYISRSDYGSSANFVSTIKTTSGVSTVVEKNGKLAQVLKACSFSDPAEAGSVKAKYGH